MWKARIVIFAQNAPLSQLEWVLRLAGRVAPWQRSGPAPVCPTWRMKFHVANITDLSSRVSLHDSDKSMTIETIQFLKGSELSNIHQHIARHLKKIDQIDSTTLSSYVQSLSIFLIMMAFRRGRDEDCTRRIKWCLAKQVPVRARFMWTLSDSDLSIEVGKRERFQAGHIWHTLKTLKTRYHWRKMNENYIKPPQNWLLS